MSAFPVGPNIPGSLGYALRHRERLLSNQALNAGVTNTQVRVALGPPFPGSLAGHFSHFVAEGGGLGLSISPLPPPPPFVPAAYQLPLINRNPTQSARRRQRFDDQLSSVHNSLVRKGQLQQVAPEEWQINVSASGAVTSFNTRTGAVTLTSLDVTTALGPSGVTPGTYSLATVTVNAFGLLTGVVVGSSPLAIGNAVSGGTPGCVLFLDDSANLKQDSAGFFVYDFDGSLGPLGASQCLYANSFAIFDIGLTTFEQIALNNGVLSYGAVNVAVATIDTVFTVNQTFNPTGGSSTTPVTAITLDAGFSSAGGVGFGPQILAEARDSTTSNVAIGAVNFTWATATHASRKGRIQLLAYNTSATPVEGFRVGTGTSAAEISFFGATEVVQQTAAGETAGYTAGTSTAVTIDGTFTGGIGSTQYTLGDVVAALKKYNLLTN